MKRLLIVEDDPTFARHILGLFSSEHTSMTISPTLFDRGIDAMNLFKEEQVFDLAIIDLGLPDISGIEVIQTISKNSPHLPILVISALSSEQSLFEAILAGARGYLLKGDSDEFMMRSIQHALKGEYPISPIIARFLFKYIAKNETPTQIAPTDLTRKELEVLQNIANGRSYLETSQSMAVSVSKIQTHVRNLYKKLNVHSQTQAALAARNRGLI